MKSSDLRPLRNKVIIEPVRTDPSSHGMIIVPEPERFEYAFAGWVVAFGECGEPLEVNDFVILNPGIRNKVKHHDYGQVCRVNTTSGVFDLMPESEPYIRQMVSDYRRTKRDYDIRAELHDGRRLSMNASDVLEYSLINVLGRGSRLETPPPVRIVDLDDGTFYFASIRNILAIVEEW